MADIKKFLDQEGVKFLWSKISMQDYPNNDTLMAVIEAIDETKADKTDLVQSDWNESDETSLSYIKNKPDFDGLQTNVFNLNELVGDTPVSEQISAAVAQKASIQMIIWEADD